MFLYSIEDILCPTMLIKAETVGKQFGFILSCISVLWKWLISKYANNRSMINILLPSWLGCVIYLNSMCGDMVHDDIPAILKNADVNGKNPWYKAFTNDFWGNAMSDITSHKSYRPITTLLFRYGNQFLNPYRKIPVFFYLLMYPTIMNIPIPWLFYTKYIYKEPWKVFGANMSIAFGVNVCHMIFIQTTYIHVSNTLSSYA